MASIPPEAREKLTEPNIAKLSNGLEFSYLEEEHYPTVQVRDIHKAKSGDITCELTCFHLEQDIADPIRGVRFNLNAMRSRKDMAKIIRERIFNVSDLFHDKWELIIEDICWRTLRDYRSVTGIEEVTPLEEIPPPTFLIYPILPLYQPTIIFGDGAAGKGHVAMTLAILAQLPYHDNELQLITPSTPTNVLYLDYENPSKEEFTRILSGLCKGFDRFVSIKRLRMSQPLSDIIGQLKAHIIADNIGLVIVDSLAYAAGGNINDAETANKYNMALSQLECVTILTIAHNSKDLLTRTKSVFGSTFFTTYSRSVWEAKRKFKPNSPEMPITLTHQKSNRKYENPIGLLYTFDDTGTITTERSLITDDSEGRVSSPALILEILETSELSVKEIAHRAGLTEGHVSKELTGLNKANKVVSRSRGIWGLVNYV